jgi:hypothetical protein
MDALDLKLSQLLKQLPRPLKLKALNYLKSLSQQKPQESEAQKEFNAGFGGAKGLFVLKKDWDDNLSDEFTDYR